jgi:hypothetical protein
MSKVAKADQANNKAKQKYQIENWSSYNQSLVNRGNITLYISDEAIKHWKAECPKQRGGQYVYSDTCIETIFMLKTVFKLAYRQAIGFTQSLLLIMGYKGLKVPSYTQVNRRVKNLDIQPLALKTKGSITIAIDSTGVKVFGEGEWKVRKHGYSKRRTWRKLHLGVDPQTGVIHCHSLTLNDVDDACQLKPLLAQVKPKVKEAYCDGAYDHYDCWQTLIEQKINPVIPPRAGAVQWYAQTPGDSPHYPRNQAIERIDETDRQTWKKESKYHRRSLAETTMFRFKTIHGPSFFSRKFETQQKEADMKIKTLNIMTAQGMPISKLKMTA